MLLAGAVFALFMTGFWLYCLTDAILTPTSDCRGLSKTAWVAIIAVTFIAGAIAWFVMRPPVHSFSAEPFPPPLEPDDSSDDAGFLSERWTAEDDAVARHPAGRARTIDAVYSVPKGPDDDDAFLHALDRVIRGNFQAGEEV
jgi:Phospholipase_D-nuclease N-terminal